MGISSEIKLKRITDVKKKSLEESLLYRKHNDIYKLDNF